MDNNMKVLVKDLKNSIAEMTTKLNKSGLEKFDLNPSSIEGYRQIISGLETDLGNCKTKMDSIKNELKKSINNISDAQSEKLKPILAALAVKYPNFDYQIKSGYLEIRDKKRIILSTYYDTILTIIIVVTTGEASIIQISKKKKYNQFVTDVISITEQKFGKLAKIEYA